MRYGLALKGYRVKSVRGHHQKLIEFMGEHFNSPDIVAISDRMRQTRNFDIYGGGVTLSEEEIEDYIRFVKELGKTAGIS